MRKLAATILVMSTMLIVPITLVQADTGMREHMDQMKQTMGWMCKMMGDGSGRMGRDQFDAAGYGRWSRVS